MQINYQVSEHTCNYYSHDFYLDLYVGDSSTDAREWQDMPIYDVEEMRAKDDSLGEIYEDIQILEDRARKISYVTRGR